MTFPVPSGTVMPIRVDVIRFLEIRPEAQYHGDISIADLMANVPPPAAPSDNAPVHDPVIITNGTVDNRPQRIAILSDGQFVARSPNSALVANVRKELEQIVAAKPDRLIIDGDFVDEASPADIAFAKQVIDEEVGNKIRWTYVPGNHEVMGGPIDNFKAVFGATHIGSMLGSTKIITLNSSSLTLHGNDDGIAQLTDLEQQLRQAAKDPRVTGVLIATHVPVDDPLSDKASQLGDRIEAQQLTDRLGRFRAQSGKSVAVINGHVGVFSASSEQGVSMIINGNSGKTPAGNVTDGGFLGWTMLGINPRRSGDRLGWLQAETHPRVDAVQLTAPGVMAAGSVVTLAPTFSQGSATVPIGWPVSAAWSSEGAVRFNPTTDRLTAVRPGSGRLTVVVNGVKSSVTVTVTARP
ncbi:MAG: metallophosphoesterase family protein [Nakamurella sp.]